MIVLDQPIRRDAPSRDELQSDRATIAGLLEQYRQNVRDRQRLRLRLGEILYRHRRACEHGRWQDYCLHTLGVKTRTARKCIAEYERTLPAAERAATARTHDRGPTGTGTKRHDVPFCTQTGGQIDADPTLSHAQTRLPMTPDDPGPVNRTRAPGSVGGSVGGFGAGSVAGEGAGESGGGVVGTQLTFDVLYRQAAEALKPLESIVSALPGGPDMLGRWREELARLCAGTTEHSPSARAV